MAEYEMGIKNRESVLIGYEVRVYCVCMHYFNGFEVYWDPLEIVPLTEEDVALMVAIHRLSGCQRVPLLTTTVATDV